MSNPTLADLCALIADSEHKTAPKDTEGQHPLVRTTDLGNARVDFARAQRVNADTYAKWTRRGEPRTGDLILAREAPVGGIARVPEGVHPVLGQRTVLLRPSKAVDSRFLMYRLAAADLQARMNEMATGSTVPHLNMSDIRAFEIPDLPALPDQKRRAAVLAAFDELIAINERRIELLEGLARSLYREWFVRFRFPGWDSLTFTFTDTPIGFAPADWQVDRLGKFVTTQYGFTASATTEPVGPRFLRGMDINKRTYTDWSEVPYCKVPDEQLDRFRLDVGDVCVVRMADPGKVGIVERPVDAVFASYLVRMRSADARLGPQLLAHYLRDTRYQDWVTGSSTGTTRKSASASVLTEPLIVLPPIDLADHFERKAGALRSSLNSLVEQNAALARPRELLLPRLVTGRLDISDIDLGDLLPAETAA